MNQIFRSIQSVVAGCILAAILSAVAARSAVADVALAIENSVPASVQTPAGAIEYDAIYSRIVLEDEEGEATLSFVSFAYIAQPSDSDRPITFFFNGGPGSSSVWLHFGFGAPVRLPDEAATPGWNGRVDGVVSNPLTLLPATDLVFIDPIGTGFSRTTDDDDDEYWAVEPDAESVSQLVRAMLDVHGREGSPVFLAGESYGGLRAAAMLEHLQADDEPVNVEGVILISPALDSSIIVARAAPESLAARLPTFAALAALYGMLDEQPDDLGRFLDGVSEFAKNEYLGSIDSLPLGEQARLAETLEAYTGVSTERILRDRGRVTQQAFQRAARRAAGGSIGELDGRVVAKGGAHGEIPYDTFGSALQAHLAETWAIDTNGAYRLLNTMANTRWRGHRTGRGLFSEPMPTIERIESAQERDPDLRVFVATGYYDMVTPFASARWLFEDSNLARGSVTLREYPAGHMVYLGDEPHEAFANDVMRFIRETAGRPAATTP